MENILISLGEKIVKILQERRKKIVTAESCTGGLLAYCFTSIAGASKIYDGGIISYANAIKQKYLGVSKERLEYYGAVSQEVVEDMLIGALKMFEVDFALASSGVAGPDGGSEQKPIGTVYLGVQELGKPAIIKQCHFNGNRNEIQQKSCLKAMQMFLDIL